MLSLNWYTVYSYSSALTKIFPSSRPSRSIGKYTHALLLYPARNFNSPRTRWAASCSQRSPLISEALLGQVLNDLLFHDSRSNCNPGNLHFNHFSFYVPRNPDTFRCRHPLSAIVVSVPSIQLHIPVIHRKRRQGNAPIIRLIFVLLLIPSLSFVILTTLA